MFDGSSRLLHRRRKMKKFHLQNIDYRFRLKNSFHISLNFHKCSGCLLHIIKNYMKSYGTRVSGADVSAREEDTKKV